MDSEILEFSLICPVCKTKTVLVSSDVEPIIFNCDQCLSHIMLCDDTLYPIRSEFLQSVLEKHRFEECGGVIFIRKSTESSAFITNEKLADLKETLKRTFFVEDFLKNL